MLIYILDTTPISLQMISAIFPVPSSLEGFTASALKKRKNLPNQNQIGNHSAQNIQGRRKIHAYLNENL